MIKELHELAWYAQKSIWRDEALLSFLCNGKKEIISLYRGILATHYRTDEEAARGLGISLTSFKKYGKILMEHLYEMVFFHNDEKTKVDATVKNIYEGAREMARMRMLAWRSCRLTSKATAQQLLRRGLQYDWPEFVVEASLILKESVVRLGGTDAEFERYSAMYYKYRHYLDLELQAWEMYQRIKLSMRRKAAVREPGPERIMAYLKSVEPLLESTPSYFFQLYYFVIRNHYHLMICDYPGVVRNCDLAIEFFKKKPYPVVHPLSIFYNIKVAAHIMMGNYQDGRAELEKSLAMMQEGTANWFSAKEVSIYLFLHEGSYQDAFDLYTKAYKHRRLHFMHPDRREFWQIMGAYCFLIRKFCRLPDGKNFPDFRSKRFQNDLPGYSRDKLGMNVAILVACVLLQLVEGRYDEMPESIQALNKYRSRHLRNNEQTLRSEIFIRLLGMLPRSGYDRNRFAQLSAPILEQLRAAPLHAALQPLEQEVIPYESLVEMIIQYLPERPRRTSSRRRK